MASAGSTAPPGGAPQPAYNAAGARRVALNGKPYTWDEFAEYYGHAAHEHWDKASPANEEGESVSAGDARQLAVHAADGGAPQPAVATADACRVPNQHGNQSLTAQFPRDAHAEPGAAASSDASQLAVVASDQAQPLECVCTYEDLVATRREPGFGGRMAWAKGKALRKECMDRKIFEKDLTFEWPEWRKCLRSLPDGMQQMLAGNGIAHFKFRLLKGKLDPNYRNADSGERHVFEILRMDGTAYHLHYHKGGTCDTPEFVEADSGAPQPAVPVFNFSPSQPKIGRREAQIALRHILDHCFGASPDCAVDITDEVGFEWRRFVSNSVQAHEVWAMELEKVFAYRTQESIHPKLAFCSTGTLWKVMEPSDKAYGESRRPVLQPMATLDWRGVDIFANARFVEESWMRVFPRD